MIPVHDEMRLTWPRLLHFWHSISKSATSTGRANTRPPRPIVAKVNRLCVRIHGDKYEQTDRLIDYETLRLANKRAKSMADE